MSFPNILVIRIESPVRKELNVGVLYKYVFHYFGVHTPYQSRKINLPLRSLFLKSTFITVGHDIISILNNLVHIVDLLMTEELGDRNYKMLLGFL